VAKYKDEPLIPFTNKDGRSKGTAMMIELARGEI
jgi:hypothetical protein